MKIAITGGIGSGKSTVAKILTEAGYNVYSCDLTYTRLLKDKGFLDCLRAKFGDVVKNGELDRNRLADIVFSDGEQLAKLNAVTHPRIFSEMFDLARGDEVAFFEVPLLFEEGNERLFDEVLVIKRDTAKRIACVSSRDKIAVTEVDRRIKSQINYDNFDFAQYYVIHNNGDLTQLRENIFKFLHSINL